MAVVYLGLGSNIGDRTQHLVDACAVLHRHPAITVQAVSSLYHTAPVGVTAQDWFLNAVACLHTTLHPPALLCVTQATERRLGRVTTLRWGPRIIDLDILLYDERVVASDDLIVPHPRMTGRPFVMTPLAEIASDFVVPGTSDTVSVLAKTLGTRGVKRIAGPGWDGVGGAPQQMRL